MRTLNALAIAGVLALAAVRPRSFLPAQCEAHTWLI